MHVPMERETNVREAAEYAEHLEPILDKVLSDVKPAERVGGATLSTISLGRCVGNREQLVHHQHDLLAKPARLFKLRLEPAELIAPDVPVAVGVDAKAVDRVE
jgi:hypothetical protein